MIKLKTKLDTTMTIDEFERCMEARSVEHVSIQWTNYQWHLRGVPMFRGETRESCFAEDNSLARAMLGLIKATPKLCCKCGDTIKRAVLHDAENERCKKCADPE